MSDHHLTALPNPAPDADTAPEEASGERPRATPHAKPGKPLPTDRMKFAVQVAVLKAFADCSGPTKRAVGGQTVGQAVGVHPGTAALCNNFFVESGWLTKVRKGEYAATDALWKWFTAQSQNDPQATAPLREAASRSWYWTALAPRLAAGPTPLQTATLVLMVEGGAHPEHAAHVHNLIQWMAWTGLAVVDNDSLRAAEGAPPPASEPDGDDGKPKDETPAPPAPEGRRDTPPADPPLPESTVQKGNSPAILAHQFEVHVTGDDLAKLSPEQIRALFEAFATIASITSRRA